MNPIPPFIPRLRASPRLQRVRLYAAVLSLLISLNFSAYSAAQVVVDAPTERIIKGSLKWLAEKQQSNGSWITEGDSKRAPAAAMTAYTLMAFMSAGNLPEQGEYAKTVAAGMQFLLDAVQPDGLLRGVDGDKYMYNHGIATIALAELYGETKSPVILPKLQRLIRVILAAQNKEGGWRYRPNPNDADISVSVLQVVALRAAKNAGMEVPQATVDHAVKYVGDCYNAKEGGFTYQARGGEAGFARTAAAIYSLQVCGQYDDPLVKSGSDYLFNNFKPKLRWGTYGNYYAAPAQYMIGGEVWRHWYSLLQTSMQENLKWIGDSCYWETRSGDDVNTIYLTAVNTKILAMPWHYMPLYQR